MALTVPGRFNYSIEVLPSKKISLAAYLFFNLARGIRQIELLLTI